MPVSETSKAGLLSFGMLTVICHWIYPSRWLRDGEVAVTRNITYRDTCDPLHSPVCDLCALHAAHSTYPSSDVPGSSSYQVSFKLTPILPTSFDFTVSSKVIRENHLHILLCLHTTEAAVHPASNQLMCTLCIELKVRHRLDTRGCLVHNVRVNDRHDASGGWCSLGVVDLPSQLHP